MTKELFEPSDASDPLKGLEAALAIDPSPAFAAGVRARIAGAGPRGVWPAWQGVAAAAAVTAAILGGITWRASQIAVRPAGHAAIAATAVEAPIALPSAAPPAPESAGADRAGARVAVTRVTSKRLVTAETLVPPDQANALNQWLAALQQRKAATMKAAEAFSTAIDELPKIVPVQIEPIRIDPLGPNPPPSGGKEKDR